MRLSKLTNDYLTYIATRRDASKDTVNNYRTAYEQFQGWLLSEAKGTDDMRHFNPDKVEGFVTFLYGKGIKPISVRARLTALSSFAKWAMRQKDGTKYVLDSNPLDRVERPRKTKPKSGFLYGNELAAVLALNDGYTPSELLARDILLDTGLRVSEVSNAKVEDLWQDQSDTTFLKVKLKGGAERNVPLGKDLAERLIAFLREREVERDEPLLVNREGGAYSRSVLSEVICRMGQKAGITRMPVRPHKLRHTYNVVGRLAGHDVTVRAELLNHKDTQTLQQYDHTLAGETAAARESVRAAMKVYAGGALAPA